MLAVWYEKNGAAREVLRLGEQPDPLPGRGEVRVRLHASAVNPSDVKARGGSRPVIPPHVIPNSDGAGVIDRVAQAPNFCLNVFIGTTWVADGTILQRSGTTLAGAIPVSGVPLARYTLGADSTLAADVIGATTETAHTGLTLTSANLGTARRLIKFYARLHVISSNAADTWTFRLRLGGLTGTLLFASAAIDIENDDVFTFEGYAEVRTTGAGGTFDAMTRFSDVVADTSTLNEILGGAVDTTASADLVVTVECSSANAGNQVSLRHFSAEVMPA